MTLDVLTRGDMMGDLGIANTQLIAFVGGMPTGGTYTLSYQAQTTTAIAYNAAASDVQSALSVLSTIGAGNVQVTAEDELTFRVILFGGLAQTAITASSSLTGASLSVEQVIVFSDNDLQRLYDRATAADDGSTIYERAIAYGYRFLYAASLKLHDVRFGQTSESFNQVTKNFETQTKLWEQRAGIYGGTLHMGTLNTALDEPYSVSMQNAINAYLTALRNA